MELYFKERKEWRKWLEENPGLGYDNARSGGPVLPEDLLKVLVVNRQAIDNFYKFNPSERRMYILWLNSAIKNETRLRRIEKIVMRSINGIPPGMM
jgi:uncharacterized protein YdeI (YjbR/CyaY-like superfamily)